jgi:hypothetical protein
MKVLQLSVNEGREARRSAEEACTRGAQELSELRVRCSMLEEEKRRREEEERIATLRSARAHEGLLERALQAEGRARELQAELDRITEEARVQRRAALEKQSDVELSMRQQRELTDRVSALEAQLARAQADVDAARRSADAERGAWRETEEALQATVRHGMHELERLRRTEAELRGDLALLEKKLEHATEQVHTLSEERAIADDQLQQLDDARA